MDYSIGNLDANILHGQALLELFPDAGLYLVFPCGQDIIHLTGAHGVPYVALRQVFDDRLRRLRRIQIFDRVCNLVFEIKVYIDKIIIAGNHKGFALYGHIGFQIIAHGKLLGCFADFYHLLEIRDFKLHARRFHNLGIPKGTDYPIFIFLQEVYGVE